MVPLLALMITVLVPVSSNAFDDGELPPLHPERYEIPTSDSISRHRIPPSWRAPLRMRPTHTRETGSRRIPTPGIQSEDLLAVPPLMVIEALACPLAERVTWAGLKLQVIPTGRPEQERLTAPASPPNEVSCRVMGEEVEP
jgi:hypothetical protein